MFELLDRAKRFETLIYRHYEIGDFAEVAQNCKYLTEIKRRKNKKKKEMKKKKKKKLRTTGNEEERRGLFPSGSKARFISLSFSLFFSVLFPLSSFCFHEGEEPVCIRGAERKNRKSERKGVESRLAALPLLTEPTRR